MVQFGVVQFRVVQFRGTIGAVGSIGRVVGWAVVDLFRLVLKS